MKKKDIYFSICAGLTGVTLSGLLANSSIASLIPSQLQKQVSQPNSSPVEPLPSLDEQLSPAVLDTLPEPEIFRSPATIIQPQNGEVDIRLVNDTNVPVRYSVLGDTDARTLAARSDVYLSGLGVPVEMTFYREDNGFVTAIPQALNSGVLELRLDETASFSTSESGLIIEETGDVVIN